MNLAIAEASAVAALVGLVFVALSINLTRILTYPGLVGRAGEALVLLIQPMFAAMAVLIPEQSFKAAGAEILVIGLIVAATTTRIVTTSGRVVAKGRPPHEFMGRCVLIAVAVVPIIVAGLILIDGSTDGIASPFPRLLSKILRERTKPRHV